MVRMPALGASLLVLVATAAFAQPAVEEPVWIVAGGLVVAMDDAGTIIPDGGVAVRGNRIEAVGPAAGLLARYPAARRLDANGRIVMPGLVNAHNHVPMTLFRGVADDLDLEGFLYKRIFPIEARFVDEEFVRWGTRLACLELLRGGVTTFADMYYFEDAIAEEAARCGMRAVVGETLVDFPAPDNKTWDAAVAATERFLERWRGHSLGAATAAADASPARSGCNLFHKSSLRQLKRRVAGADRRRLGRPERRPDGHLRSTLAEHDSCSGERYRPARRASLLVECVS